MATKQNKTKNTQELQHFTTIVLTQEVQVQRLDAFIKNWLNLFDGGLTKLCPQDAVPKLH